MKLFRYGALLALLSLQDSAFALTPILSSAAASSVAPSPVLSCSKITIPVAWTSVYQAEVGLSNSGTQATNGWVVYVELAPNQKIDSIWNGVVLERTLNVYKIGNLGWNAVIQPGGTANFGMNILNEDGSVPVSVTQPPVCRTQPIVNRAPSGDFYIALNGATVNVKDLNVADPDGDKVVTKYDFGDNFSIQYSDVWHTYRQPGTYTITQTLSDGKNITTKTKKIMVGMPIKNRAPVAMFSFSSSNLISIVKGTGSADPEGKALKYTWDIGQGPRPNPSEPGLNFQAPEGGNLVTLTVSDGEIADTVQHFVFAKSGTSYDNLPEINFTYTVDGTRVNFDASGSRFADSFTWDFGDGTTGSGTFVSHQYGVLMAPVTVTVHATNQMMSARKSAQVMIGDAKPNTPPTVTLTCDAIPAMQIALYNPNPTSRPYEVTCRATATDLESDPLAHEIRWGDTADVDTTSSLAQFSKIYNVPIGEEINVSLTVRDAFGNKVVRALLSTNQSFNRPPKACMQFAVPAAMPGTISSSLNLYATGACSTDADGDALSYVWDFGDGTTSVGAWANHTYAQGGTYTVKLTVSDGKAQDSATQIYRAIAPVPPVACFTINPTFAPTLTLGANASCSKSFDFAMPQFRWNFGDGTTGTGLNVMHTYARPGEYLVTLTVISGSGLSNSLSQKFTAVDLQKMSRCEYKIVNEWNTGYVAYVRLFNQSLTNTLNSWSFGLNYAGSNRITSSWNGVLSGANPYSISNATWNGKIAPGAYAEFGFQVDKRGGAAETPLLSGMCQ